MVVITQKVNFLLEYFTKGAERFSKNAKRINTNLRTQALNFEKLDKIEKSNRASRELNLTSQMRFGEVMALSQERTSNFIKSQRNMRTASGKAAMGIRNMTHGMRGFRMEMLGVMFFGMALTSTIMGLMKTSLEWAGVMEILSSTLGILFLPVALMLLDWALVFLGWVSKLTEGQKKWIGIILLVVAVLGIFLTIVGTLALGIGSILLVFGGFTPIIIMMAAVSAVIAGIGFIIFGVIQIIANWGKVWHKVVAGISKVLFGLALILIGFAIILAAPGLAVIAVFLLIAATAAWVVSKVIKHWDKIKDFFRDLWQGIKDGAKSAWEFIKNIFSNIGGFIGNPFKFIGSVLGFKHGGIVPGKLGTPVPIIAHAGERIIPANRVGTGSGVSESNITNNFYGFTTSDLRRELDDRDRILIDQIKRNE